MSLTIIGLVVAVLATFAKSSGVMVTNEALQTTVLTVVQLMSAVGIYYGRYRVGGITLFGARKK